MTTVDVIQTTRAYLVENFLYMRSDVRLAESDSLLGQGIIDSMGVIELVQFIQDTFGVTVEDEEITELNLGSLAAIARYVSEKQRAEPVRATA